MHDLETIPWRFRAIVRVALDVYNWLLPLVAINLLWLVMSATIILLPPATAGLYEIAYTARSGREPYIGVYLGAVRKWLLRSWVWGVVTLLLTGGSLFAIAFYSVQEAVLGGVLHVVSIMILVYILLVQFYFWPYMLLQEEPYPALAARNAALTVLGDLIYVAIYAILTGLLVAASVILILPAVLITPVLIAFLGTYSLREWLEYRDLA